TGGQTPVRCPRPGLRITLGGPAKVIAGQQTTLSLRLRNTGKIVARNVLIADTLPQGFSLVKSSKPHVFRAGALKVRVGTLRPACNGSRCARNARLNIAGAP